MSEESDDKQQQHIIRNIYRNNFGKGAVVALLESARFGESLDTPAQIAVHNERMELLRALFGENNIQKFRERVAEVVFNI